MKNAILLKITVVAALSLAAACQQTQQKANVNDKPTIASANANGASLDDVKPSAANTNAVAETPKTETIPAEIKNPSGGSLATPIEAYKTAYAARENKDLATLKRAMSKDALEFMEIFIEPGKTIDDAVRQMTETPQAATDDARGEKIAGDHATIEYPDAQGKWKTMDLVKENGEWKITMPKPELDSAPGKTK